MSDPGMDLADSLRRARGAGRAGVTIPDGDVAPKYGGGQAPAGSTSERFSKKKNSAVQKTRVATG